MVKDRFVNKALNLILIMLGRFPLLLSIRLSKETYKTKIHKKPQAKITILVFMVTFMEYIISKDFFMNKIKWREKEGTAVLANGFVYAATDQQNLPCLEAV